jgi:hypothetical protein
MFDLKSGGTYTYPCVLMKKGQILWIIEAKAFLPDSAPILLSVGLMKSRTVMQ